jgi:hypothetical protein
MYLPIGVISLVLLLLVFFRFVAINPDFRAKYTMEIIFATPKLFQWIKADHPEVVIPPDGGWNVFQFTDIESANISQLGHLRQSIGAFKSHHETETGIRVQLHRKMSYNNFVQIVDILNIERINRYSMTGSDIWVHPFSRRPKSDSEYSHLAICGGVVVSKPPPLTWIQKAEEMINQYKSFWQEDLHRVPFSIISAWLIIFVLNIYQIYRYNHINSIRYLISSSRINPPQRICM